MEVDDAFDALISHVSLHSSNGDSGDARKTAPTYVSPNMEKEVGSAATPRSLASATLARMDVAPTSSVGGR